MTLSNTFLYDDDVNTVVVCVHKCNDKVEGAAVDDDNNGGDETVNSMHFVAENGNNDDVADGDGELDGVDENKHAAVINGGDDT